MGHRYSVVVWDCDREMGGPEEGGWSYETGTLVLEASFASLGPAEKVAEGLRAEYPYTGQRGMFSKRGPDYSVVVLDRENEYDREQFAEDGSLIDHYPVTRPHYE